MASYSRGPANDLNKMKDMFVYSVQAKGEQKLIDFITKDIGGRLKLRFGEEIILFSNGNNWGTIEKVNKWISKYDSKFNKRVVNDRGCLINTSFIIELENNTFIYVRVGEDAHTFNELFKTNNPQSSEDLKIYIFGRKYKKYYKELHEITAKQKDANMRYIYNVSSGQTRNGEENMHSIVQNMHNRDIDTLFYNKGVKEEIIDHINNFIDNKHIYEERDLLYKTGILLYGEPGTGKTSLATALATYFKYDLVCVDMGSFDKLDVNTLTSCINCDTSRFIILLEDIDCLYNLDRNQEGIDKDDKKVINKMLQFLDSNNSPRDVIFIATTNHYHRLDPAILRDGRFDIKVEVTSANQDTASNMCKSFGLSEEETKSILNKIDKFPVNQSKLQNMILEHFKSLKVNN